MDYKHICLIVMLGGLTASFVYGQDAKLAAGEQAKVDPSHARLYQAKLLTNVTEIFLRRCSECHGEENARPKGDFGFIMDLARLSKDPDYIVPGDPQASEVYFQIDSGDMPPPKSKFAPMSDSEKQVVADWIRSGAFAINMEPNGKIVEPPQSADKDNADKKPAPLPTLPLYYLLGKLHPVVIHFPIALIIAAGLAELFSLTQRRSGMKSAVTFCLLLGSAGAVVAAISGWIFAMEQGYPVEWNLHLYSIHRWLGLSCAILSPILLWVDLLSTDNRKFFRVFLFVVVGLVMATGHFGGMLVYGAELFKL